MSYLKIKMKKTNIKAIIDNSAKRIMLMTEATTRKILKKELRKLKKDLIKKITKLDAIVDIYENENN